MVDRKVMLQLNGSMMAAIHTARCQNFHAAREFTLAVAPCQPRLQGPPVALGERPSRPRFNSRRTWRQTIRRLKVRDCADLAARPHRRAATLEGHIGASERFPQMQRCSRVDFQRLILWFRFS